MKKVIYMGKYLKILIIIISFTLNFGYSNAQIFSISSDNNELLHKFWLGKNKNLYVTYASNKPNTQMRFNEEYLSKFDSLGNEIWVKRFDYGDYIHIPLFNLDSQTQKEEIFFSSGVKNQKNNGFNPIIFKIDSDGSLEWKSIYNEIQIKSPIIELNKYSEREFYFQVLENNTLQIYFINNSGEIIRKQAIEIKLDENEKIINLSSLNKDEIFVLTEYTLGSNKSLIINKLDSNGNKIWAKEISSNAKSKIQSFKFKKTQGSILISYVENGRTYLKQLNEDGILSWEYQTNPREYVKSIIIDNSKNYCVMNSPSFVSLFNFSDSGEKELLKNYENKAGFKPSIFKFYDNIFYLGGRKKGKTSMSNNILILKADIEFNLPVGWE